MRFVRFVLLPDGCEKVFAQLFGIFDFGWVRAGDVEV